jgi:hypothetical protein
MQFTVTGLQPGRNYVLEQSGSLPAGPAAWESMVTILNASESFQFTDPEPPAAGHRYYRLRVIP